MTSKGERDRCTAHAAETVEENTVSRGIENPADAHPPATEYCQLFAGMKRFVEFWCRRASFWLRVRHGDGGVVPAEDRVDSACVKEDERTHETLPAAVVTRIECFDWMEISQRVS
jgi:hypothetical protein